MLGLSQTNGAPSEALLQMMGKHAAPCAIRHQRRANFAVHADTSRGFGPKKAAPAPKKVKKKSPTVGEENDAAVQKALQLTGNKARPVDKDEAAKGRVDYANVKNWGSGEQKDLGKLQLESFKTGSQLPGKEQSFYVHLTFSIVQAEEQGLINQHLYEKMPVKGRENLPDYEQWSFKLERYVQYLADQRAVHQALEGSVAEALAANRDSSIAAALDCFSESRGLDRSQQIGADLTNIGAAAPSTSQPAAANEAAYPEPTAAATSYVRYLGRIGRDTAQGANERVKTEACLKLMTHAYTLHLLLLTKGSTIGARGAERLKLFDKKAIHTYRSYPFDVIGKDPLKALQRNVNQAGDLLSTEDKETLVEELPRAMAHGVQLWETLAYTD